MCNDTAELTLLMATFFYAWFPLTLTNRCLYGALLLTIIGLEIFRMCLVRNVPAPDLGVTEMPRILDKWHDISPSGRREKHRRAGSILIIFLIRTCRNVFLLVLFCELIPVLFLYFDDHMHKKLIHLWIFFMYTNILCCCNNTFFE